MVILLVIHEGILGVKHLHLRTKEGHIKFEQKKELNTLNMIYRSVQVGICTIIYLVFRLNFRLTEDVSGKEMDIKSVNNRGEVHLDFSRD